MSIWKSALHNFEKYGKYAVPPVAAYEAADRVGLVDKAVDVGGAILDNTVGKAGVGNLNYAIARYAPIPDVALNSFNDAMHWLGAAEAPTVQETLDAYEKGFNGRKGGRGVWELQQNYQPGYMRFANDIAIDPLTWVGGIGVGKAGSIAKEGVGPLAQALTESGGETLARGLIETGAKDTIVGGAKYGAGKVLRGAQLVNDAPARATEYIASHVLGTLAKTKPGQWISGLSPREAARKELDYGYSVAGAAGIVMEGKASSSYKETLGNMSARATLKDYASVVEDSGMFKVISQSGRDLAGTTFATEDAARKWYRANRLKLLTEGGRLEKPAHMDIQISSAWNDLSKGRPVSKASDRILERGKLPIDAVVEKDPKGWIITRGNGTTLDGVIYTTREVAQDNIDNALSLNGKSADWVLSQAFEEARAVDAQMKRWGLAFSTTPSKDVVRKALAKLSPEDKAQALKTIADWKAQEVDILTAPMRKVYDKIAHKFMALDRTVTALDDKGNSWLWDNRLKSGLIGETYGDALKIWGSEFSADKQKLVKAVGPAAWRRDANPKFIRAILTDKKEAISVYNKWAKYGVDLLNDSSFDAAFNRFSSAFYADHGVFSAPRAGFMHDLATVWKGQALVSPRYHSSNIISSWFNTALVSNMSKEHASAFFETTGMANPGTWRQAIAHAWKSDPTIYDMYGVDDLDKTLINYGRSVNRNITKMGMASFSSNSEEATARVFRKIHMENFGAKLGKVFEMNRRVAAGIDTGARGRLYDTRFKSYVEERIPEFEASVRAMAEKQGVDIGGDLSLVPSRDAKELLGYYRGLGFSDGAASRLSRDYANIVAQAEDNALKLVHKAHFSYYKTSLDESLSRVIPFHYYASRATLLYTEAMMKNPFLLVNFSRMMQELHGNYEDAGLNGRQKGWLFVMSGPAGYTLLANPDALFGFTKTMGLMGGADYKSDQTKMGGILTYMKSAGFGSYPIFDGLFNMIGTYGNTFEPDMLGIRHRALIGSIINAFEAEAGKAPDPKQAFYAHINADLRAFASEEVSKYLPGWIAQPVPARAAGSVGQASLEVAIQNRIVASNPGITHAQLFEIMNNQDSDEFQKAWNEVARSGVANQLMSFLLPMGMKFRDSAPDIRSAALGEIYDTAQKHGVSASDVSPSTDADFAAKYKQVTGSDWKPGDFEKYQTQYDWATSTPKGRLFLLQDEQYKALGTRVAQETLTKYNKISHGELVPPGMEKPVSVNGEDVSSQWKKMADAWLYSQGPDVNSQFEELKTLRSAFKDVNPEYGAFKDWQGKVYTLKTLLGGSLAYYREQVSKANPNAARYFADLSRRARDKYKDVEKQLEYIEIGTTTPDAWMAINGTPQHPRDAAPLATATASAPAYDGTDPLLDQMRHATADKQSYGMSATQARLQRLRF